MTGPAIIRSEFDSEIFGIDFFRVMRPDSFEIAAELGAMTQGPVIVDAKVPADCSEVIATLDAAGFRKASTLIEFSALPDANADGDQGQVTMLSLSEADLEAHARGFRFQRFAQDARIPKDGSVALMRRWISVSLAGRRETLAIGRNFCTYSVDAERLTIDLLSCLDVGQGFTARLMSAVHAEAVARGCGELRVTTEAENVPALKAYLRAGFRPVRSWAAMHMVRLGTGARS